MPLWDVVWFILIGFAFLTYLMALWLILGDLFHDSELSGWIKALWVVALLFVPFLSFLLYLVIRGHGMTRRPAHRSQHDGGSANGAGVRG